MEFSHRWKSSRWKRPENQFSSCLKLIPDRDSACTAGILPCGKGSAKSSAPGAVIIHFLGGIHEIYFPYILMNPLLLLSVIAGGASGIFVERADVWRRPFGAGFTGKYYCNPGHDAERRLSSGYTRVLVATAVSFFISMPILKFAAKDEDLPKAQRQNERDEECGKGHR